MFRITMVFLKRIDGCPRVVPVFLHHEPNRLVVVGSRSAAGDLELRVAQFFQQFGLVDRVRLTVEAYLQRVDILGGAARDARRKQRSKNQQQASPPAAHAYLLPSKMCFNTLLRCCACQIWSDVFPCSNVKNLSYASSAGLN